MEKNRIRPVQVGEGVRMSYSKQREVLEMPNLIEVQTDSYRWFLEDGLNEVLRDISPIADYNGNLSLEFVSFELCRDDVKYSIEECKERDATYAAPLKVKVRLHNNETEEISEHDIFMGDLPLMTATGTFVINGAERVIVSQLVRSPGIYYGIGHDKIGKELYSATVIPNRGAWLEYETDSNDIFYVRVDRNRKVPITVLIRALGVGTNQEILDMFGEEPKILASFAKDPSDNYQDGLLELYKKLRPGEPLAVDSAENLMHLIRYTRQNCAELAESHFYKIDSELAAQLNKEKEMEQLISDAIINDRLEVWYQPIYSTELRRFASAEALVRIRRENGDLVPPADFIPIAESNGSILKVGETVFRKVCEFLNKSEIDKHGISYIEINLSVVQCAYEKLAEDYISIMADYGISPKLINLEITESASMNAKKTLLENMKRLTSYGVNFSLDDFGTGQSNLDYIVDMPVDIVKFDKGMTSAYFENGKAKYIMDAAMSMIQGMNLKIVSEGIETEEQFKVMNDLGINYIQGYYFSKPLSADEFMEFIIKNNN